MDRNDRPVGRQEHVTSGNGNVAKHGEGLNLGGPQGNKEGVGGRPGTGGGKRETGGEDAVGQGLESLLGSLGSGSTGSSAGGGNMNGSLFSGGGNNSPLKKLLPIILLIVVVLLFFSCGKGLLSGLGSGASQSSTLLQNYKPYGDANDYGTTDTYTADTDTSDYNYGNTGGSYAQATSSANTGTLDMQVASGAREKYTQLKGGGKDTVTVMVYMCGTDLESKSGMATSDLTEMTKATIGSNVSLLVYTGGCTAWKNSIVSSETNQIYQVESGGVRKVEDNIGSVAMTDPDNLGAYIQWCKKNYAADRYELILWDHGGGTLSGYGYDEKFPNSGSMSIDKIASALKTGGTKFDFIGFDACLMANLETALTVTPYADYLLASEETEPGYGWYYTDWLTDLSENTSIATTDLGKVICDTFTSDNAKRTNGDSTTLSLVDLAELEATIPDPFASFGSALNSQIKAGNYSTIADARASSREYAAEEGIDQIDLCNFCDSINSNESKALAAAVRSAVKYNMTSSDMTNSYGLSVYFPYQKLEYVSTVLSTYKKIDLNSDYQSAVRSFASLESSGQISAGGSSNPLDQLLGGYSSSGSSNNGYDGYSGSNGDSSAIDELLSSFLSGRSIAPGKNVNGLTSENSDWIDIDLVNSSKQYLAQNAVDTKNLVWTEKDGKKVLQLSEAQWKLIEKVELSLFYDDGNGYIDLGLDNLYSFDDDGNLVGNWDGTWLALNGQIVPYYLVSSVSDDAGYTIIGRIPAMLNEEQVDILVQFTTAKPDGVVLGARKVYDKDTETQTKARGLITIKDEDVIQPICDYYNYDGTFQNNYELGNAITVSGDLAISNVALSSPDSCSACYRLTDLYNDHYWTPAVK